MKVAGRDAFLRLHWDPPRASHGPIKIAAYSLRGIRTFLEKWRGRPTERRWVSYIMLNEMTIVHPNLSNNIPWFLCPINCSHFNALINMEKCIGLPCANVFFIDNNIGIYWSKQDGTKTKPIMQFNDEHKKICLEHSSQATSSMFWGQKKVIF